LTLWVGRSSMTENPPQGLLSSLNVLRDSFK
jgi:hypothetical protein